MFTTVIVNPVAGGGRAKKAWPRVEAWLKERQIPFQVRFTGGPGHASSLAREATAAGGGKLVVMGGDGTLHEAVNGMELQHSTLALIPVGGGNDFARTLGIPFELSAAAVVAFAEQSRVIDLGRVNGRYFLNVAGVGFDAQVAAERNRTFRFLPGASSYLAALFKVLFTYRNAPLLIEMDGVSQEMTVLFVAVGNAQYYGGGMRIVPQARIDDSLFHLCIAGDTTRMETLATLPKVFSGGHVTHPKVRCASASAITISSVTPLALHADGEVIGTTPAEFHVVPGALRVAAPGG